MHLSRRRYLRSLVIFKGRVSRHNALQMRKKKMLKISTPGSFSATVNGWSDNETALE